MHLQCLFASSVWCSAFCWRFYPQGKGGYGLAGWQKRHWLLLMLRQTPECRYSRLTRYDRMMPLVQVLVYSISVHCVRVHAQSPRDAATPPSTKEIAFVDSPSAFAAAMQSGVQHVVVTVDIDLSTLTDDGAPAGTFTVQPSTTSIRVRARSIAGHLFKMTAAGAPLSRHTGIPRQRKALHVPWYCT